MSRPYRLTAAAEQDANDIWDYVATGDIRRADRLLASIETAIRRIVRRPGIGHLRQDLADDTHRFYLVGSYLIVYRADSRPLEVLRILHASRDAASLL